MVFLTTLTGQSGAYVHGLLDSDMTNWNYLLQKIELRFGYSDMKESYLVEEKINSNSPWSSGLVLVQKKDLSRRLCVDYKKLNDKTIKDSYPIPRIEDNIDALSGAKWMSVLDLRMAYHQVPMNLADKEKTAFSIPRGGLYQYVTMPFGLCNAGTNFQRIIKTAMRGFQWYVLVLNLDDMIVPSEVIRCWITDQSCKVKFFLNTR
ncbi:Hypothetical predicted protein [Mytilus galloprovincialis]|uniref:Reverse transcriptase domain-containing protein n=1 Tax=Mytilus galloprovincialis TaxID=29158 RepID=A0A8B6BE49_MYTGA|nr:Hypothetical predicted protein [Mytilus galloprovincialis]